METLTWSGAHPPLTSVQESSTSKAQRLARFHLCKEAADRDFCVLSGTANNLAEDRRKTCGRKTNGPGLRAEGLGFRGWGLGGLGGAGFRV